MHRQNRFWKPLLDAEWSPLVFLAGAALLGVFSNGLFDWAKAAWGTPAAVVVAAALLLAIVGLFWLWRNIERRLWPPDITVTDVAPLQALIVLVSQGKLDEIPATGALRYHHKGTAEHPGRLTHCCFIAGKPVSGGPDEAADSSWSNAVALRQGLEQAGVTCYAIPVTPDDSEEAWRAGEEAWRWVRQVARIPASEIIADITGGRKPMTIGLVLAALETGCKLQYLHPRDFTDRGIAIAAAGADPKLINLCFLARRPWEGEAGD